MTEPSIFNETFDEVRFIDSFGKSTFSYQTPTQAKEVSYPRGEEYKVYEHIAYVEYDRKVINPKDFNTTVVDLRELVIFHAKDLDAYDEFNRRFYDDGNSVIRHEVVHAPNEPARYNVVGGKQLYYIPAGSIQTVDLSKIR